NFALIFEVVILSFAQAHKLQTTQVDQQIILQKREERFRGIFDTSFDAIIVFDKKENKILQANSRTASLFEYPASALTRLDLLQILKPLEEGKECFMHFMQEEFTDRKLYFCETYGIKNGNIAFDCEITISPLPEQGSAVFVIAVKDVSKRKQAERKLEKKLQEIEKQNDQLTRYIHSNSELQNFAYIASHDMRQPLRTIKSFSQLIERNIQKHEIEIEEIDLCLEYIISSVAHLDSLIQNMLEHSKVHSLHDFEFSKTQLMDVLLQVKMNLHTQIKEAHATISFQNLPELSVEPRRIMQLFQNLISNSLKFKHPERDCNIEISSRELSLHWLFQIKDNGIGIPKEKQKEVFQLFKRLHGKSEYAGHGIGLATCQKIVEAHGGSIWIHTENELGCSVFFTLKKDLNQADLSFGQLENQALKS
ncbi:MAG: ATP-binding protein, partial [Bacteroidota bacterium]